MAAVIGAIGDLAVHGSESAPMPTAESIGFTSQSRVAERSWLFLEKRCLVLEGDGGAWLARFSHPVLLLGGRLDAQGTARGACLWNSGRSATPPAFAALPTLEKKIFLFERGLGFPRFISCS
eukprot:CAMPEP_0180283560 /NCGR_PEP_ID=MMETSP0988-20121125/10569_1 /TAXON_ID=697907 /ORGANISM="non described non described, Strain CCMP2293" /LENGTH=121 /DNA_ID=CAMNT_0022256157 /DNA_START=490 /DNA_END=851 /DNA_ORIENTATION=+